MRVSSDEGGWGFERVVWMADVWGWWVGGDGDGFTEKREGQARHGCLKRVCAKFRKDAKQIKHTQTFALRKMGAIVRMRNRQSVH